uniref:Vasoactive intestinal polypeptide receptor n=1 Tax=Sphaerodactylus townsendi TaxID=933632 RepID=A0ACB8FW08_9SAUR
MLGNVSRNCTSDGWSDLQPAQYFIACGYNPNLTGPAETIFYGSVRTGYTIGHSLSLIALTIAMIVLCIFRKLHCTRNYIHMHLFMSFILRAIAVFVKDVILFENGESDHCYFSTTVGSAQPFITELDLIGDKVCDRFEKGRKRNETRRQILRFAPLSSRFLFP